MSDRQFRVFYSYSHHDIRMLERLRTHMAMLRREGLITEWYDRDIEAGSKWRDEIDRELEAADLILLLVSADFLASEFCYEDEMKRAVERAQRGEALVIGVMLRPVEGWETTPFAEFQLVPRDARPITKWSNADEAYTDVVEGIRAALNERAVTEAQQRPQTRRSPTHRSPRAAAGQAAELAKQSDPTDVGDEILTPLEIAQLDLIADPDLREAQRQLLIAQKQTWLEQMTKSPDDIRDAVRKNLRA
jgi:hypothetical protein